MKFGYSLLQDFVQTKKTAEELGDLFTMAGFEVEGIEDVEGEKVLDVKVVSNRGDGLSVLGLAREVLAKDPEAKSTELYERAANRFPLGDELSAPSSPSIEIQTSDCTRYAARIFEGDFSGQAPAKIRQHLQRAGIRSISLLVDLTNYVMLETGQPMHAFDLDKLHGQKVIVRNAKNGEKLTTLDGQEHELNAKQMMISDADRPVGAAGIMGGLETEVTGATKRMLLESAHFVNTSVRRTRKEFGLSTEASYRFERSVDPEGVVAALNRFAELLALVDGGKTRVPGVLDVYPHKPKIRQITLRTNRASELLGMQITPEEAKHYLERLGFVIVSENSGEMKVEAPTWRPDIIEEYDLIEEIGRVHGYERIPEAPLQGTTTQGGVFGLYAFIEEVRDLAMRLGFIQNISHTLRDVHPLDDPKSTPIKLPNPSSPEMALLRNSLWPNLADNARRNGSKNLQLFEIGAVFGAEGPLSEKRQLAFIATGSTSEEHFEKGSAPSASFFSMKGAIEEILAHAGNDANVEPANEPRLHPTRQAKTSDVLFGQIHPDIAELLGLPAETFLAQVDLERLYEDSKKQKQLKPVSRNPAVRRDVAILIDQEIPYATINETIQRAAGEVLEKQWLFDVYSGKGIPEGKHSLAIALQLRKFGENLTDEEANQVRDRAVRALEELGAKQR